MTRPDPTDRAVPAVTAILSAALEGPDNKTLQTVAYTAMGFGTQHPLDVDELQELVILLAAWVRDLSLGSDQ